MSDRTDSYLLDTIACIQALTRAVERTGDAILYSAMFKNVEPSVLERALNGDAAAQRIVDEQWIATVKQMNRIHQFLRGETDISV